MSTLPNRPSPSLREAKCHVWLLWTFLFSLGYAIVRYNVFKGVAWEHLPLYVVNKSFSLSAVILLASSYLIGRWIHVFRNDPVRRLVLVKFLGLAGFGAAAIHALMSMALLSPAYFPKFFGEAKMSLTGELTILFSVSALFWITGPALSSLPSMHEALGDRLWHRSQRAGYLALGLVAGHVFVMGFKGWLEPSTWPGSMPPITMLGFVIVVLPLLARLLSKRRDGGEEAEV